MFIHVQGRVPAWELPSTHSKINGSGVGEFFCFHSTWTGMTGTATGQIASHCSFLMQADHMIFVARLQCRLFVRDKESIHCYWFGPHSKNADLWVSWYKGPSWIFMWCTWCLHTKSIQKDAGYFLVVAAEEITVLTMGDIECCTFAHMALINFFSYLPLFFAVIIVGIHNLSLLANIWKRYFHSCWDSYFWLSNKQGITYIVKALKFWV